MLNDRITTGPQLQAAPLSGERSLDVKLSATLDAANTLAQYTRSEMILPCLRQRTTAAVIGELCLALQRAGRLRDPLSFYDTVMSRETLCSSVVPPGWAMPHARMAGLPQLFFAVGRSPVELEWFGQRNLRVRMVFLLAVPEHETGLYLSILAGLARLSQDPALLQSLHDASDSRGIYDVLRQVPLRAAAPVPHGF